LSTFTTSAPETTGIEVEGVFQIGESLFFATAPEARLQAGTACG
jgi:hypothetical protein